MYRARALLTAPSARNRSWDARENLDFKSGSTSFAGRASRSTGSNHSSLFMCASVHYPNV